MYIVGIDIGKRNHEASIMNAAGKQYGKPIRFANSHTGFNKLMDWVKNISGADDVVFGMEATGHYWLALYTHLCHEGYAVHVINAVQSDALRGMYIRQAKNDSRDSFIIAEVIRFGRFCETAVSAPELHALRELCRHRFWIVDSVSDLKRKVIALLDQVFPEYENLFTNTFGKTSLQLLSEYTTPEELLAVDWNSQENRTPMSKTLSGKRAISEASPFDQWREVQFIGSVAPAAVVVGLDPAEYDLANLIPLHGGELEPVDQFLLQRCEKTLHARIVKAAMRAAHALPDGTEPGEHRPVLLAGVLAAVVGMQNQTFLVTIT